MLLILVAPSTSDYCDFDLSKFSQHVFTPSKIAFDASNSIIGIFARASRPEIDHSVIILAVAVLVVARITG
jgi:hypothetical protein